LCGPMRLAQAMPLNITFTPASAPVQPFESYALPVTANNQGTNWTGVLFYSCTWCIKCVFHVAR
jgi:hypothetical protein